MLTILASFAQEESKSVSDNCKWRIRKSFANGDPLCLTTMYGYRIKKGNIIIEPNEAEIVRSIFYDYVNGVGVTEIVKKLTEEGVPTFLGSKWSQRQVYSLLRNEKYAGNALLQKTYKDNHLTKLRKKNESTLPKYFAEGTHPAIIGVELFNIVQETLNRNAKKNNCSKQHTKSVFTGKIQCSNCGANYKRKKRRDTYTWICSTYDREGKDKCFSKQIPEDILYATTYKALGKTEINEADIECNISKIIVPEFNQLIFIFRDGRKVECNWQDRSRKESWDEKARLKAREKELLRRES